jgi:hypothetical protein
LSVISYLASWLCHGVHEQFSTLVDKLATYESDVNPLYYVMCFVDGVKEDIKSMVMIRHPFTLDSACALTTTENTINRGSKQPSKAVLMRTCLSWIQLHPHVAIRRHLSNMINSFLCSSTKYFEIRSLPND